MSFTFPSHEFDEAVAAVCHGSASDAQMKALNELLRHDARGQDEYILRLELHSRLASDPDLFVSPGLESDESRSASDGSLPPPKIVPFETLPRSRNQRLRWAIALAAGAALLAVGWWEFQSFGLSRRKGSTTKAVAMLSQVVGAQWNSRDAAPRLGAPLEPGRLRLRSGLAQIVFYSGARVAIEGPADLLLISPNEASCSSGRIVAEVPPQARGFRVKSPQMDVTDLGTSFGLEVKSRGTELHVFNGLVQFRPEGVATNQDLHGGSGALKEKSRATRFIAADSTAFASLFDMQAKALAAEAQRYERWRTASAQLNRDSTLILHLDFEGITDSDWKLSNMAQNNVAVSDAAIIGCRRTEGRWRQKRALEFQNVNDRVRLAVPGEYDSLTLSTWISVKGLDRQLNSLFMCDGFEPGTLHWLIRNDGVLGLTVVGPSAGSHQILATPRVLTLDQLGMWMHLAVVIDGNAKTVIQYVNGVSVSEKPLRKSPPFHIGAVELGNWEAGGGQQNDPRLIRNFSGAMDEFCLFGRALDASEIYTLYSEGKPQSDSVAKSN